MQNCGIVLVAECIDNTQRPDVRDPGAPAAGRFTKIRRVPLPAVYPPSRTHLPFIGKANIYPAESRGPRRRLNRNDDKTRAAKAHNDAAVS